MSRDTTWNTNYGMLFIDNPVGAGYSYTGTDKGALLETPGPAERVEGYPRANGKRLNCREGVLD